MKIACVTQVRNECDFIEYFIRTNRKIFDHFYILENQSTDATPLILEKLKAEGIPMTVVQDKGNYYDQGDAITNAVQFFARQNIYDWFIPLDADEVFLCSKAELETGLKACGEYVPLFRWKNWAPTKKAGAYSEVKDNSPGVWKVAVNNVDGRDCTISHGNHSLHTGTYEKLDDYRCAIELNHFPVRSIGQMICKAIFSASRFERTNKGLITHVHEISAYIREKHFDIKLEDLQKFAAYYPFLQDGFAGQNKQKIAETKVTLAKEVFEFQEEIKYPELQTINTFERFDSEIKRLTGLLTK